MDHKTDFYTLEELSAFKTISNQKPADKLSDRYGFIPTMEIAQELYANGWQARVVRESKVKNPELQGTQKHMIRFARNNGNRDRYELAMERAGLQLELVFFGSHDGSTKLKMFLGFLRFCCFNEQVTGDMLEEFCFIHRSQAPIKVESALQSIQEATPDLAKQINKLVRTDMNENAMYAFARRAIELKHGDDWFENHQTGLWKLLKPKRVGDQRNNLFNVYNRCQEKLIRGQYKYITYPQSDSTFDASYRPAKIKEAKPVKDIAVEMKLNQGLWQQAVTFGEYLSA